MLDPDAGLISRVAQGDEVAFSRLVETYQRRVLSTIYRYVKDASAVEDIAQEVFIKVWENAHTFKGRSKFSTWLYRIVVNHCLNYRTKRKRGRTVELDESMADEGSSVEEKYENKRKAQLVKDAVYKLPERQRMALILFKFEGCSCREVARVMGLSFIAAQSLIFRAIDNLRRKLSPSPRQEKLKKK